VRATLAGAALQLSGEAGDGTAWTVPVA